jgi:glycosyltransferase involved in cell wall biosynthesis
LRIGIYIEPVKASDKTGISRYIIGLVESLVNLDKENTYYLYYQTSVVKKEALNWLNDLPNVKHRPLRFPHKWLGDRPRLWWQFYLPIFLSIDKINVFHGPNHYIPLKGKIATVLTIHDLAYYYMEVHGEGMDKILKNWTNQNLQAADLVVAISDSTASDCVKEGVDKKKVKVVYQGFESKHQIIAKKIKDNHSPISITRPYILFIGTIQPRKNVLYILEGFARIADDVPHTLVLAGAPGESSQSVKDKIEQLNLHNRVILTGYISDNERHFLYENADIFLYPSKYEGFGLVLLEAMSYGLPVITANNSSMPETAGNAAILVDEHDASTLAKAIMDLINDTHLKQRLVNLGYQRIKEFKWETCAQNMLEIYKSAVHLKNRK